MASMTASMSDQIIADKAEIDLIAEAHNDSTGLSWLWAFLFGPFYFWIHGFVAQGFLILILNFFFIGFIISPFLAYPAWNARAKRKAEKLSALSKVTRR